MISLMIGFFYTLAILVIGIFLGIFLSAASHQPKGQEHDTW